MRIYAQMVGNESIESLKEDNKRLKSLVKKYETESKNIISKSLIMKDKEKTSVMETLELFRLNAYLIQCLPNAEQILDNYLKNNQRIGGQKKSPTSLASTSVDIKLNNKRDSNPKSSKKPTMKPISNYFKTVDKKDAENGGNDSDLELNGDRNAHNDSDVEPDGQTTGPERRRSPRKLTKDSETSNPKTSQRKRKQINYLSKNDSSDEECDRIQNGTETPTKRRGRPAANESKRDKTPEPAAEESKTTDSKTPRSVESKEAKKSGPKRARRSRVPQQKGYFVCTFDSSQCNEIMDTKEQLEFHMSGHYNAEFVCPFCAYTGPTIQIIKRHINIERERAAKEKAEGLPLNEDGLAHNDRKYYHCFGCKACDKIHEKMEKRCEHIREDIEANECDFSHDIDYEFKDHLKKHFEQKFTNIKDKDERKQRIRKIVDNFVEKLYFENNAKKHLLVEKYKNSKDKESTKETKKDEKNESKNESTENGTKNESKTEPKKSVNKVDSKPTEVSSDSDSGWDD